MLYQGSTEAELRKSYEDRKKMIEQRDSEIMDLRLKIDSMEKAYENVLRVSGPLLPSPFNF